MLTHDDLSKIAELITYFGFLAVGFCCVSSYIVRHIGQAWDGAFEDFLACFPKRVVNFLDRHPFVHKVLIMTVGVFLLSLFWFALGGFYFIQSNLIFAHIVEHIL